MSSLSSFSRAQKVGIFMFMLGTIPILSTSISTTLLVMNIHGDAGQPAPVVGDVLAGTVVFATAGAVVFGLSLVNWTGIRDTAGEVLSR